MVGNSAIQSQQYTNNLGWGSGSQNNFKFNFPYFVSSPGLYKIKTWVSSVNGLPDQDVSNDTATFYVSALSASVPKNCLVEQFLSANDGNSPDAYEKILALQTNTTAIGVNIHENDSLYNSTTSAFIAAFKKTNSTALFDRSYFFDNSEPVFQPADYTSRLNKRLSAVSPVSVSIIDKVYNSSSNTLSFTVKADFAGDVAGNFNIGAYLTENHVHGSPTDTSVNGYNQLNNYYHVPWSPYYQKGYYNPLAGTYVLNAWQYKHRHVLIHAFDSLFGTAGSITPSIITTGQSFSKTYTLSLPATLAPLAKFRPDNIYIVAYVAEAGSTNKQRSVLNSAREKMTVNPEVVSVEKHQTNNVSFLFYPNPAHTKVNIEFNGNEGGFFRIKNLQGQMLSESIYFKDKAEFETEKLPQGLYILEIETKNSKISKKLIVQHP